MSFTETSTRATLAVGLTADAARVLTDEVKADAAELWSKLLQLSTDRKVSR